MNHYQPIDTAPKDGTPILTDIGLVTYHHHSWILCDINGIGILTPSRHYYQCKPERWILLLADLGIVDDCPHSWVLHNNGLCILTPSNHYCGCKPGPWTPVKIEQKVSALETGKIEAESKHDIPALFVNLASLLGGILMFVGLIAVIHYVNN